MLSHSSKSIRAIGGPVCPPLPSTYHILPPQHIFSYVRVLICIYIYILMTSSYNIKLKRVELAGGGRGSMGAGRFVKLFLSSTASHSRITTRFLICECIYMC